jgi:hypothetical protein
LADIPPPPIHSRFLLITASPILRFLPYGKFEIRLNESERHLWCGSNG